MAPASTSLGVTPSHLLHPTPEVGLACHPKRESVAWATQRTRGLYLCPLR